MAFGAGIQERAGRDHGHAPKDLPPALPARQTAGLISLPFSVNALAMLVTGAAVVAVSILVGLAFVWKRGNRRRREVRQLLDAADALEARLRTARSEFEAVAGEEADDPVRDAMREMLRQRLWLREHGEDAALEEIRQVRSSIDEARLRIEQQLLRIDRARAPVG